MALADGRRAECAAPDTWNCPYHHRPHAAIQLPLKNSRPRIDFAPKATFVPQSSGVHWHAATRLESNCPED